MEICGTNVAEFSSYIVYQWLKCHTKRNLRHKCRRISIIYPIWGWRRAGLHCLSVTTMSNQAKSAAWMSQNFHYIPYLGMEKGGVTLSVRRSTSVSQTNGILRHKCCRISIIHCILYSLFGDGEGWGYTVCTLVNICQSNQWNSAARMSQNFHHTLYISDYNVSPMVICCTIVTEFSLF
jgi:hypothetical protein